ncbi:unannotated protein [freshwater metagenome]|uniref:Unannotated protein n=1 Tax=freshwater metagenome TaxID=449393 RepID=A0A6J7CBY3_9ZZZZ
MAFANAAALVGTPTGGAGVSHGAGVVTMVDSVTEEPDPLAIGASGTAIGSAGEAHPALMLLPVVDGSGLNHQLTMPSMPTVMLAPV